MKQISSSSRENANTTKSVQTTTKHHLAQFAVFIRHQRHAAHKLGGVQAFRGFYISGR